MSLNCTAAEWIAAFSELEIAGINCYSSPLAAINSADLPVAFPINYGLTATPSRRLCVDKSKERRCTYMVAFEARGKGTQSQNHALYAQHLDAVEAALDALDVEPFMQYDYRTTSAEEVAGVGFWGVVIEITGSASL